MNNSKLFILGATAALTTATYGASAKATDLETYVGIDYSFVNVSYELATSDDSWAESAHGLNPYFGVQVHENIGIELGYLTTADAGKTTSTASTDISVSGFHLDAVGSYPVNDKFNFIGTVGLARLKAEAAVKVGSLSLVADDTDTAWRIGVGGSYDVAENVAVRSILRYNFIDWEDSVNGFVQANIGLQYRF